MPKSKADLSPLETAVAVVIAFAVSAAMIALIVALAAALPLGLFWGLNTLFGLGIPITWKTVGAAFVLCWVVRQIFRPRAASPAKF